MNFSKINALRTEIKQLEKELDFISVITAVSYEQSIHSNSVQSPTESIAERREKLNGKIKRKKLELLEEIDKLEKHLNDIDDPDIRLLARWKYVDGYSWTQIEVRLREAHIYMSRTSAFNKFHKYFK